ERFLIEKVTLDLRHEIRWTFDHSQIISSTADTSGRPRRCRRGSVSLMHVAEHRSAGCWCVAGEKGKNPLIEVTPADEAKSVSAGSLTICAPTKLLFRLPRAFGEGDQLGTKIMRTMHLVTCSA
ncbi:hypothetical protein M3A79_011925, partial [Micrococcus luteus]|nr:hypothetical protein [Micrococcus luteus]